MSQLDFVRLYDDAVSFDLCNALIDWHDTSTDSKTDSPIGLLAEMYRNGFPWIRSYGNLCRNLKEI